MPAVAIALRPFPVQDPEYLIGVKDSDENLMDIEP
jgi:hypothetical protein